MCALAHRNVSSADHSENKELNRKWALQIRRCDAPDDAPGRGQSCVSAVRSSFTRALAGRPGVGQGAVLGLFSIVKVV